jgi:hypothetical protein
MQVTVGNVSRVKPVQIEVFSPTGERIASRRVPANDLQEGDILRLRALGGLAPGSYLLRLRSAAGADSLESDSGKIRSLDYPIRLRIGTPSDSLREVP